ncbi:MAG: glycoside hydrolase family 3 C-terminal domain-containing protein, partial [Clostridia bacterium]|nr:glycoside hydrolase family 3 C-terminal domain-containing protein [Clostridia bacterium]
MSKKTRSLLSLLLVLCIGFAQLALADVVTPTGNPYGFAGNNGKYYTDYQTLDEEQVAARKLAVLEATEGFVLLKNENNVLPLAADSAVSLFGMHSISLVTSTVGSAGGSTGANGVPETTLQQAMELAGFAVNPKLIDLYTKQQTLGYAGNELPVSAYSAATISTYNGYHDAAIVVFSRTGSEAVDKKADHVSGHSDPTDHEMMLDDNEKALIKHVKAYYQDTPIIVLINSSNILQIPELAAPKAESEYGVDAIFWVGNTGNNGIEAIGKLISGEVNPSGHTVEIWEKDFTQGPTWTNFGQQTQNDLDAFFYDENSVTPYATIEYREGISLGYKYYETKYDDAAEADKEAAYANVLYPFGYGLSYTTFDWELVPAAQTAITDPWQKLSMQVKVTNTGKTAGKDVVQVYANPPYTVGGIEKASANLVGFAKTGLLQSGESEVVTIEWVAQDMASFDWNDANNNGFIGYELEAGSYEISARRNSHEKVLTETYEIADGILATKDYTSGKEITALFVDDFTSVSDSLLGGMISRANGLEQPKAAS